jgi:protocatechuate 3,4-dioxygenase beta subunit
MTTKIKSEKDAQKFITDLYFDDKLFHLEDLAEEIFYDDGKRVFNDEESKLINKRVDEVFKYIADPFILWLALQDAEVLNAL